MSATVKDDLTIYLHILKVIKRNIEMEKSGKHKFGKSCFQWLQFCTLLFCLICFSINVWNTIGSYFNYERVLTAVETDVEDGNLEFPALALCDSRAFREPRDMVSLEDYEINTIDPKDFVIAVNFRKPWHQASNADQKVSPL